MTRKYRKELAFIRSEVCQNTIGDERQIEAFGAELVDRFGPLPEKVEHLLQVVAIVVPAGQCGKRSRPGPRVRG
jgi:hypothetical protein